MNEENIEFIVSLRGGSEAAAEAAKVKGAITEAGGAVKAVDEASVTTSRHTGALSSTVRKLAYAFIALGAGYRAVSAARNAITFTKDLAEQSTALAKATGMSVTETSRYIGVADALGVSSSALSTAFKGISTQTEKQAEHTGKSKTAFDKLGISTSFARKHQHDFNGVLELSVKRFNELQGGPEKTKIATELFGRTWKDLNPLLGEGVDHMKHLLGIAKEYGVELHGGLNKELEQLRDAQLENTLATEGLRIQFTKIAAKPMMEVLKGFARMKKFAGEKNWKGFNKELEKVFTVASRVIETFEVQTIETFGQLSPKLLKALWNGFKKASLPNKALMAGIIASKMGLTGAIFGALGKRLGGRVAVRMGEGMAAEGAAASVAGTTLGGLFGAAFLAAALGAGLGYLITKLFPHGLFPPHDPTKKEAEGAIAGQSGPGTYLRRRKGGGYEVAPSRGFGHTEATQRGEGATHTIGGRFVGSGEPAHPRGKHRNVKNDTSGEIVVTDSHGRTHYLHPGESVVPGAWKGANVRRGGLVQVGERGPELLNLPAGAQVDPLKPGSLVDDRPMFLQVDGKVLGRIVRRQDMLSQAAGA